jgi:hypothetical protein
VQNFFSSEQIAQYEDAFESIHESFGRDVVVVKESKRVYVSEINSNYNYFYSDDAQKSLQEVETPVSGVFKMRVLWSDPSKELFSSEDGMDGIRPKIHNNTCRLKMRKDAYDFINGYKEFIVDGRSCEWVGFSKQHGIVKNNFFTIILKETN